MSRVRVACLSLSVDGYCAAPGQSLDHPLGHGGLALHEWLFPTAFFKQMTGQSGGSRGVDQAYAERGMANLGAWILGRNMFSPLRGPWRDESWQGWWGDTPPYHCEVFVLTHHPRPSLQMQGGTVFHFVSEGIEVALARARAAAGARDVRIGGGAQTVRQYLQAGLIDELHLAIAPVLLGQGESLLAGLDLPALGYHCAGQEAGEGAQHLLIRRR